MTGAVEGGNILEDSALLRHLCSKLPDGETDPCAETKSKEGGILHEIRLPFPVLLPLEVLPLLTQEEDRNCAKLLFGGAPLYHEGDSVRIGGGPQGQSDCLCGSRAVLEFLKLLNVEAPVYTTIPEAEIYCLTDNPEDFQDIAFILAKMKERIQQLQRLSNLSAPAPICYGSERMIRQSIEELFYNTALNSGCKRRHDDGRLYASVYEYRFSAVTENLPALKKLLLDHQILSEAEVRQTKKQNGVCEHPKNEFIHLAVPIAYAAIVAMLTDKQEKTVQDLLHGKLAFLKGKGLVSLRNGVLPEGAQTGSKGAADFLRSIEVDVLTVSDLPVAEITALLKTTSETKIIAGLLEVIRELNQELAQNLDSNASWQCCLKAEIKLRDAILSLLYNRILAKIMGFKSQDIFGKETIDPIPCVLELYDRKKHADLPNVGALIDCGASFLPLAPLNPKSYEEDDEFYD